MLTLEKVDSKMAGRSYRRKMPTLQEASAAGRLILTAESEQAYSGLQPVILFLAGPILGLVYVFFLPLIGIPIVVGVVFEKFFGGVEERAYRGAVFSWQPGEVYLAGKMGRARRTISRKEEEKKE